VRALQERPSTPVDPGRRPPRRFETIHPFEDGNGRSGRALIHVLLRRRWLAPSGAPPVSVGLAAGKDRYIDGLIQYRGGDLDEWIERLAVAPARAADLAELEAGP
jgi:Fic family protein